MTSIRRTCLATLGGLLIATSAFLSSPVSAARATPADPVVGVAIVIEGQGYGHGRGMSQYGAYGWATGSYGDQSIPAEQKAKDWTWILDHYYGGTQNALTAANKRMTVSLSAINGLQTAVISSDSKASVVLTGGPVVPGTYASLVAREISASGVRSTYTYRVYGSSKITCPSASDPLSAESGWTVVGEGTAKYGKPIVTFSVPNGDVPTTAPASLLGVCGSTGNVVHYRGTIFAANGSVGENRTVNDVPLEQYLRGVVPSESPASWGDTAGGLGINALRAQAVAARSYSLAQGRYTYAKTCDTQSCQVYLGAAARNTAKGTLTIREDSRTDRAIADTALTIRVRPDKPTVPVVTEFSSSNGARNAGVYFPAVDDPGDSADGNPHAKWTRVVSLSNLAARLGLSTITKVEMILGTQANVTPAWDVSIKFYNGTQSVTKTGAWLENAYTLNSKSVNVRLITSDFVSADDFVFIGDSVGESIAGQSVLGTGELPELLTEMFNSTSYFALTNRCTVGRCPSGVADGLSVANALTGSPDFALVALGYNDNQSTLGAEIDQVMTSLVAKGIRSVGWVTMSERRTTNGIANYAAGNAALRAAKKRWPQLRIFDWDAASIGGPRNRWFAKDDNVHLTTSGQAEFAIWLRDRAIELAGGTPSAPQWVAKVGPGVNLRIPVLGEKGIPSTGVSAVSLNITASGADAAGFITVWPCNSTQPSTPNMYFSSAQLVTGEVLAAIDGTGKVCVASSTPAHIYVDVNGYFTAGFRATSLQRVVDTRADSAQGLRSVTKVKLAAKQVLRVKMTNLVVAGVPAAGVGAVVLNITAVNSVSSGYITAYNCEKRPRLWNLSFSKNTPAAAMAIVPVKSLTGEVCIYSSAATDIMVDIGGWFAAADFGIIAPQRIADTRESSPQGLLSVDKVMISGTKQLTLKLTDLPEVPMPSDRIQAVVLRVSAKALTMNGYVTVYPCGDRPRKVSVRLIAGQTSGNTVIVPLQQTTGRICVYSSALTDVIVDIAGWIANGKGYKTLSPVMISDTSKGIGAVPGR